MLQASRTLWAPTEEEAAKIRSHIPEAFVQGRKGGLSADQWSERLRLASWTHDPRKVPAPAACNRLAVTPDRSHQHARAVLLICMSSAAP